MIHRLREEAENPVMCAEIRVSDGLRPRDVKECPPYSTSRLGIMEEALEKAWILGPVLSIHLPLVNPTDVLGIHLSKPRANVHVVVQD